MGVFCNRALQRLLHKTGFPPKPFSYSAQLYYPRNCVEINVECGVDVGSIWGQCGVNVGSKLGRCRVDVGSMKGRCGVDVVEGK